MHGGAYQPILVGLVFFVAKPQKTPTHAKGGREDLITAKVLGRHAHVVIGYGRQVQNAAKLWDTVKSEVKSGFLDTDEPGAITTDADLSSGYIYAQIPLLLDLEVYFGDSYEVKYEILR